MGERKEVNPGKSYSLLPFPSFSSSVPYVFLLGGGEKEEEGERDTLSQTHSAIDFHPGCIYVQHIRHTMIIDISS